LLFHALLWIFFCIWKSKLHLLIWLNSLINMGLPICCCLGVKIWTNLHLLRTQLDTYICHICCDNCDISRYPCYPGRPAWFASWPQGPRSWLPPTLKDSMIPTRWVHYICTLMITFPIINISTKCLKWRLMLW